MRSALDSNINVWIITLVKGEEVGDIEIKEVREYMTELMLHFYYHIHRNEFKE